MAAHNRDWDDKVERVYRPGTARSSAPSTTPPSPATWSFAAGSMPADLHKLWRTRDPKQFHLEYGNSCIRTRAIGIRWPTRAARSSPQSATPAT